ncbi:hypothetical protein B0H16DRAFT_1454228 [Mycena metata]|uniref:DUF6534 domain-containing protein n=1 Tax=Mycena metata TaxID=1033252 RepID=A0AAD7JL81_9AGAR|nr:hypothetical protein B0H16DRAFT_1454228 [Mycena metata]
MPLPTNGTVGLQAPPSPIQILLDNPATAIGPGVRKYILAKLSSRQKDNKIIRDFKLVYTIVVMELIQTAFGTHESWWYAVSNWGNFPALQTAPWTALGIAAIVSVALIAEDLSQQNLIHLRPVFMASVLLAIRKAVWLVGSFATDLLITGSMLWILQTSKSRSLVTPTNSLLNRLIVNTIQTGAATVVCAGIGLATFVKYTDKNYYYAFIYVLGKICSTGVFRYSNSFMATLNFRVHRKPGQTPGMGIQKQTEFEFVPLNPLAQKNPVAQNF